MIFKGEEVEEPDKDTIMRLYKGEGVITFNSMSFPCKFMLWQSIYGNIKGQLAEFDDSVYNDLLMHSQKFHEGSFEGITENEMPIKCERIWYYGNSQHFGNEGSDYLMKVGATIMEVQNPQISLSGMNGVFIECGLLNIDLHRVLRGSSKTNLGVITFGKMSNHENLINRAKISKESIITGFAHIRNESIDEASINQYILDMEKSLQRLCRILSIAKTTHIDFTSIDIFILQADSDKMIRYKEIISEPKKRRPSFSRPLIEDLQDFYSFIEHGMKSYTDDLDEIYNFDVAFEWYIGGTSTDIIQMDFLEICVFLETLKYRHAIYTNRTNVIENIETFRAIAEEIRLASKDILESHGYNGDENSHIRSSFYNSIGGMNRWSFVKGMENLLNDLDVKYDDIGTNLGDIAKNRNLIVHRGIERAPSEPTDITEILTDSIALSQRIILSLLKYDGAFLNLIDSYRYCQFKDFLTTAEE